MIPPGISSLVSLSFTCCRSSYLAKPTWSLDSILVLVANASTQCHKSLGIPVKMGTPGSQVNWGPQRENGDPLLPPRCDFTVSDPYSNLVLSIQNLSY